MNSKLLLTDLKTFGILLVCTCCIIFLDSRGVFSIPKLVLQQITTPIQLGLYSSSRIISRQYTHVADSRRAAQERNALREQLSIVLSENAQLRRKVAEAEGFMVQQQSLNPQTFKYVPARPIGFSRYLIIDKGSSDNIKQGMAVVFKDNLLGEVIEVSPKQSRVQLISDPASKIAAFVTNESGKARGILQGQFGSEMLLDKILHKEPIVKDEIVYSEGTENKFPRGLILGQVNEVLEEENQVFKKATVKPVFQIGELDIVFVIVE